jgi:phosphoribosylpyrophosphate synthetase
LVVSNSLISNENPKIKVVSVATQIATAITAINTGDSYETLKKQNNNK